MENLFSEFDIATAEQWKERIEKDLKGITFENLQVVDNNGITIDPFYATTPTEHIKNTFAHQDWEIVEKIIVENATQDNLNALAYLNAGATGLQFVIKDTLVDFNQLLDKIALAFIYTEFIISDIATINKLQSYLTANNYDINHLNLWIKLDPIHQAAYSNQWNHADASNAIATLINVNGNVNVDATVYNNAGANTITELAATIAQLNEQLYLADELGLINAIQKVQISIAVDTNFFEQIAKLRALRLLANVIFKEYNINTLLQIQVVTSGLYKAPFDIYSNLLRDTIAGMAGVIGGCNALIILPFDEINPRENQLFSHRMGRNQQLLFKEETYLNKIADAATGSHYIESLTTQLAEKAWSIFLNIEQEGGLITSLQSNNLKEEINKQAAVLINQYKAGQRTLIGINKYPNVLDQPKAFEYNLPNNNGLKQLNIASSIIA